MLGILALIDAAYSGDWSRIGAISKETEGQLQGIVPLLGAFHLTCAPVAGLVAAQKKVPVLPAVAKV